jgi:hypothetical protein
MMTFLTYLSTYLPTMAGVGVLLGHLRQSCCCGGPDLLWAGRSTRDFDYAYSLDYQLSLGLQCLRRSGHLHGCGASG